MNERWREQPSENEIPNNTVIPIQDGILLVMKRIDDDMMNMEKALRSQEDLLIMVEGEKRGKRRHAESQNVKSLKAKIETLEKEREDLLERYFRILEKKKEKT